METATPMNDSPRRASRSEQDAVWRALCVRQRPALDRGMCAAFLDGARAIQLDPARMPSHRELSLKLFDACGWRIETVPGLIPAEDFFALLRERRFPSPEWIRHPDDLEYTPEPDAFHDLFGHVPQLASPAYTRVLDALADAARDATSEEIEAIERVYWFTIEFGLVRDGDAVRALGAGLASSIAELDRALHADGVQRRAFVLNEARHTPFFNDRPQELYLVSDSLETLGLELGRPGWRTIRRVG
jgi:phenylalanine-4-hydroxylase